MYHALIKDIKWETLQKLRIMKSDILSLLIVCRHEQCSMLNILSAKTIFFVSFELNKLRGKCLKVQASFQGVT